MAEISWDMRENRRGYVVYRVPNVSAGDTVEPFRFNGLAQDISLHAHGTFGGTTLTVMAKNVISAVGVQASDLDGSAVSALAESLVSIRERALYLVPTFTGGDGTMNVTIDMVIWT